MAKKQKWVYFTIPNSQLESMDAEEILEVLRYDRAAPVEMIFLPRTEDKEDFSYWLLRVDATDMVATSLPTAARLRSFRIIPLVAGLSQDLVKQKMKDIYAGKIPLVGLYDHQLPIRVK